MEKIKQKLLCEGLSRFVTGHILNRSIRVHTTVLMRFRLSALKRSKTIKLYVVKKVELYAHATNTRTCDIFGHRFHFDAFSTVHTNTVAISMRFRFDPLS